jgi:hypothetical protein
VNHGACSFYCKILGSFGQKSGQLPGSDFAGMAAARHLSLVPGLPSNRQNRRWRCNDRQTCKLLIYLHNIVLIFAKIQLRRAYYKFISLREMGLARASSPAWRRQKVTLLPSGELECPGFVDHLRSLTPGPPPFLSINSTPPASSAWRTARSLAAFIRVSLSVNSALRIVATLTADFRARSSAVHLTNARAARI